MTVNVLGLRRAELTFPPQFITESREHPQARIGSYSTKYLRLLLNSLPLQVAIEELPDKVLLNIFRYYLDDSPQFWPRLVHVCRRWRFIVFTSQQALQLRLFCTHGTPVLKTLYCWPALPILVQYGGSQQLAPEDEDNIVAALRQANRVSSISLAVTSSLLEKLSAIETPFSELEDLVLSRNHDSVRLILPSAFQWGPQLRRLHLTGIAVPALPRRLSSSKDLVDIHLHDISNNRYLSPKALANTLSGMAQLQSLSFHFHSTTDYISIRPQSVEHVILPSLTRLNFRGINKYLEGFLARIDAPRLGDIAITFLRVDESTFSVSNLREFIGRVGLHKSHRQARMLSSERLISISLIQPGVPTRLKLQLYCEPLRVQLFSMAQICFHFSAFLLNVEDLRINATRPSRWMDSFYIGQWLQSINSFTGVKQFHIAGNLLNTIVRALLLPDRRPETVLPALQKLYIPQAGLRHEPLRNAVRSFTTSRRLSGHPIAVEYERQCHISEPCGTGAMYTQSTINTR